MRKILVTAVISVFFMAKLAMGAPFPPWVTYDWYPPSKGLSPNGIPTANWDNGGTGPDIHDAINQLLGTTYTNNQQVDPRLVDASNGKDNVWTNTTGTVILVGLTASNANTLGVYTGIGSGSGKSPVIGPFSGYGFLGNGTVGNPYPAGLTSLGSGQQFGWYLNSSGATYYSEPKLNAGGWDHMMTFSLPELVGQTIYIQIGNDPASQYTFSQNASLIAWEDMPFYLGRLGDEDYDDMMYVVDRVNPDPVPEPSTMLLLGSGLFGLWGLGKKFKK